MTREERCERAAFLALFGADQFSILLEKMERAAGIEPATSTLEGSRSTTELHTH